MGEKLSCIFTYYFYRILLITSIGSFVSLFFYTQNYLLIMGLIPIIILLINIKKVLTTTDNTKLDSELKKIALSTFFIAVLLAISLTWF